MTANSTNATVTQYNLLIAGANGQIVSVSPSTSGDVFYWTSATAAGSFGALSSLSFSVSVQVFTSSGTYTPSAGLVAADFEVWGAGGGGGGVPAGTSSTLSCAGGGGCGGYARYLVQSSSVGTGLSITIGSGGTAGAATSSGTGGTGGTTQITALSLSATGGSGGTTSAAGAVLTNAGGAGGSGSGGDFQTTGNPGTLGFGMYSATNSIQFALGGRGGMTSYGNVAEVGSTSSGTSANGTSAVAYSAGGGGAYCCLAGSARTGGAGAGGYVVVTEYCV